MASITVFDSHGRRLDEPYGDRDDSVRRMAQYGVVCELHGGQMPQLTVYFRARETDSGRLEQYYARYRPDHSTVDWSVALDDTRSSRPESGPSLDQGFIDQLPSEFAEEIVQYAETEHNLSVADSTTDENFLRHLLAAVPSPDPGGSSEERQRAERLLADGERLHFGAESYETALGTASRLVTAGSGRAAAITESDTTLDGGMSAYDLVVERGAYASLVPLGETAERMSPPEPVPEGLKGEIRTAVQRLTGEEDPNWIHLAPYLVGASLAVGAVVVLLVVGIDHFIGLPDVSTVGPLGWFPDKAPPSGWGLSDVGDRIGNFVNSLLPSGTTGSPNTPTPTATPSTTSSTNQSSLMFIRQ